MKKLAGTLMNRKPAPEGIWIVLAFFVFMTIITVLAWQQPDRFAWAANSKNVFADHQWWRILTSVLIHSDPQHWLSNSLLLILFGWLLAGYFGLILFPTLCLVLSWVAHLVTLKTYPQEVYLIGASGLVYVMAGVWLFLFFLTARNLSLRGRIIRFIGVCVSLLVPTQFQPEVSYRAHLIGFLIGVIGGGLFFALNKNTIRNSEQWIEILSSDQEEEIIN